MAIQIMEEYKSRPAAGSSLISGGLAIRSFILSSSLLIAVFLTLFGREILPSTYFNDERFIRRILAETANGDGGSFAFTAQVYRTLGLAHQPLIASCVSFSLFLVLLFRVKGWSEICRSNFHEFLIISGAILLSSVYLAQYSKEFLVLVLSLVFVSIRRHWSIEIVWLILALSYAYLVRDYWYIVVLLYVCFRALTLWTVSLVSTILAFMTGYSVLAVAFQEGLGVPLNYYRTSVQLILDANTLIDDPISNTGLLLQVVNAIVVMLMLFIPIPLILSLQPLQLILAAYVVMFWFVTLSYARRLRTRGFLGVQNADARRAWCLILAFVMVQAIFEPDYGSFIKHLLPLVPLASVLAPRISAEATGREATLLAKEM